MAKFKVVPAQLPSSGSCKLAFVAEAPGDDETYEGKPLIGPSGRTFNAMLRTAEIDRWDPYLYVGNVFDEKIPENNVSNWCSLITEARQGGFSDLPPIGKSGFLRPEYRRHLDRLRGELEAIEPTVIIPLGATALWAFTGETSISQCRGTVMEAQYIIPGAKLVPTYHPAHIMRQWKFFHIVVGDFIKALREADIGPQIVHPKREFWLCPCLKDIRTYIDDYLSTSELISVDIETGWGQITNIGLGPDQYNALNIPFIDLRKPSRSYWPTMEMEYKAWMMVKEVLEEPTAKLGQNYAAYDAYWLLEKYGIRTYNLRHDTRLLHHAIYPELPKDLAFLGASYSSQGAWKLMRNVKGEKRDD